MFPYSYRKTSGSLEEREIEVRKWKWVFPRHLQFSQTSTSGNMYVYGNMGKNVFYFFYKITRRKLKRRNSLLFYQSANSPYCSRWRIVAWYFHVFHTVTEIWLLVNQRSHFVISINGDINVVCCVGRVVSLWRRANARNVRLWYPISVI